MYRGSNPTGTLQYNIQISALFLRKAEEYEGSEYHQEAFHHLV
jgi:hypothetical protein